jgi:hypothetical protein
MASGLWQAAEDPAKVVHLGDAPGTLGCHRLPSRATKRPSKVGGKGLRLDRQPGGSSPGERRRVVGRVSSWLAWFICLSCVVLAAGSLILGALNGHTPGDLLIGKQIIGLAVLTIAFSVIGTLIAAHRPENAIGWVFCAAALFPGFTNFGYEYATYALLTRPGSLPLAAVMSWVGSWIWAPGLGLILVFLPLLLLRDGSGPPRRRAGLRGAGNGAAGARLAVAASAG